MRPTPTEIRSDASISPEVERPQETGRWLTPNGEVIAQRAPISDGTCCLTGKAELRHSERQSQAVG
jgi:hypothetical protein